MMKTLVETMEDAVVMPSVATEEATDTTESAAPKREISKMAIWARAHKGFIEILAPELRAQLSYYRKRDKSWSKLWRLHNETFDASAPYGSCSHLFPAATQRGAKSL